MNKEYSEFLKKKTKEENWKDLWLQPCPGSGNKQHSSIVKENVDQKNGHEKEFKTMYGCVVESHESTRQRADSLQSKAHEDRIAGEGFTSMTHYNLVHKFIPMPQAMKIPDAKAAADKEWQKTRDNSSMEFEKSQEQKGGYSGSTKRQHESPLCFIDGHVPPQKRGVRTQIAEEKGRVVLRGDIVNDDSGA